MKVNIVESPSNANTPALQLLAESDEDQTVLWCLSVLGPEMYEMHANHDAGDARASSIILKGVDA